LSLELTTELLQSFYWKSFVPISLPELFSQVIIDCFNDVGSDEDKV
jgi:hypothetical protein